MYIGIRKQYLNAKTTTYEKAARKSSSWDPCCLLGKISGCKLALDCQREQAHTASCCMLTLCQASAAALQRL